MINGTRASRFVAAIWILCLSSCTSGVMSPSATPVAKPNHNEAAQYQVKLVDPKELEAEIAKFQGKVVLVDCWATWCGPCIKLIPHSVELAKRYPNDLAVVSLSFDAPAEGKPSKAVRNFLEKEKVDFALHLQSKIDISDDGGEAFAIDNGAIPHIKIYGRNGKLFKVLASGDDDKPPVDGAAIDAALNEALKAR